LDIEGDDENKIDLLMREAAKNGNEKAMNWQ